MRSRAVIISECRRWETFSVIMITSFVIQRKITASDAFTSNIGYKNTCNGMSGEIQLYKVMTKYICIILFRKAY
jgi:hypothetical protein